MSITDYSDNILTPEGYSEYFLSILNSDGKNQVETNFRKVSKNAILLKYYFFVLKYFFKFLLQSIRTSDTKDWKRNAKIVNISTLNVLNLINNEFVYVESKTLIKE